MNKEQVVVWARKAGMERVVKLHSDGTRTVELPHPDLLERFAALVAAAEREACAKVCEQRSVDGNCYIEGSDEADGCAAAIRARSNP